MKSQTKSSFSSLFSAAQSFSITTLENKQSKVVCQETQPSSQSEGLFTTQKVNKAVLLTDARLFIIPSETVG